MWSIQHKVGYIAVSICDLVLLNLLVEGRFTSEVVFDKATVECFRNQSCGNGYLVRGDPKLRNSGVDGVGQNGIFAMPVLK